MNLLRHPEMLPTPSRSRSPLNELFTQTVPEPWAFAFCLVSHHLHIVVGFGLFWVPTREQHTWPATGLGHGRWHIYGLAPNSSPPPPPIRPTSTLPAPPPPPPGSSVKYPYWYANAVQRCPPGFHLFLAAHLLHKRQWAWRSRAVRSARHHLHVYMYHLELFMYPRFDFPKGFVATYRMWQCVYIYTPTYSHVLWPLVEDEAVLEFWSNLDQALQSDIPTSVSLLLFFV